MDGSWQENDGEDSDDKECLSKKNQKVREEMVVILDGNCVTDKESLHAYLKKQCKFPEYYGNNLDALYDLLTDREEPLELHVKHAEEIKEVLCGYGEAFLEVLTDAAAGSKNFTLVLEGQ